jgi:hypothetical protein
VDQVKVGCANLFLAQVGAGGQDNERMFRLVFSSELVKGGGFPPCPDNGDCGRE